MSAPSVAPAQAVGLDAGATGHAVPGSPYTPGAVPIAAPTPECAIPAAMRAARRWLLWRAVPDDSPKGHRKVPFYASGLVRQGELDSPQDVAQFVGYDEACRAVAAGNYTGLAFALGPDGSGNCWQGFDADNMPPNLIDSVRNSTPGYTEVSPSGHGFHAIGYGRHFRTLASNGSNVEAYAGSRFFTVTGARGRGQLADLADFVEGPVAERHNAGRVGKATSPGEPAVAVDPSTITELRSALTAMRSDDRDLWIRMGMALKELGDVGRGLWIEWSQQSDKHRPGPDAKTWDSLQPRDTGYQAVFAEAQRNGWVNPRSNAARPPGVGAWQAPMPGAMALVAKPLRAFVGETVTIEFLIDDMLRRGYLYTLTGRTGSSKTGTAILLAMHLAEGRAFGRNECMKGSVLYIAAENAEDVRGRFRVQRSHGRWADEVLDSIHVIDQSFLLAQRAPELHKIITDLRAVFVVVDTDAAVSLQGGTSENDNGVRIDHAKQLRALTLLPSRPTVLDLCHPTGSAGKDNLVPRGGSAFLNEIDGNLCQWRDGTSIELWTHDEKFRGSPYSITLFSTLVTSDAVTDTKGRQIAIPLVELPATQGTADFAHVNAINDRSLLLKTMLMYPAFNQTSLANEMGWKTRNGEVDKPKISRLMKKLRQETPPLVTAADTLTPAGKKAAKAVA